MSTGSTYFTPSESAEEVFALLKQDGLKEQNHAPVTEATTKMDALFRYGPKTAADVGVHVDIDIARDKDQSLPHRVKLAEEVRDVVENELRSALSSPNAEQEEEQTKEKPLLLCVRIFLLSDGSSSGRRYTSAIGKAKLTLAYCLQCGLSGQVGMANQLYATEDCSSADIESYWEYSSAIVRSMARKLANDITNEVIAGLDEWSSHQIENEERLEKIKVKLASEENLTQDDYAFAAEKHVIY